MAVRKSKRGPVTLLERIEAFMDEEEARRGKRIMDSTFGERFGNPRFVATLRAGGEPRRKSLQACEDYMAITRAKWAAEDAEAKRARKRG